MRPDTGFPVLIFGSRMPDYGSGIFLDGNLDFDVNSVGDIRSASGIDELHKDVRFNVYRAMVNGSGLETPESVAENGIVGEPLRPGILADIETAVGKIVGDDPRIDAVLLVNAEDTENRNNYVRITCTANIDDETQQFELVIPA